MRWARFERSTIGIDRPRKENTSGALELNPSYATAHQLCGLYLSQMEKHDEAIAETRRALQLDPLSLGISSSLGLRLYFARRLDQAIKQFADALELDSNHALAHLWLGRTYEQKGESQAGNY